MPTTLPFATPGYRRERAATAPSHWLAVPEPHARRALNVVIALLGILITAPVMFLIALAIRWTSPGPIFFVQTRVGLDRRHRTRASGSSKGSDQGGCPFAMFKFRTMRAQPTEAEQVWARPDDDRVTPLGRLLRKTRLDELPQLFNVLRGDMNVVGPRPEQPAIFARLREQIPAYTVRQRTRPGITGLAQVQLAYDSSIEDVKRKVALDLAYLRRQSVIEDLRIMLSTFPVMLGRRGGW